MYVPDRGFCVQKVMFFKVGKKSGESRGKEKTLWFIRNVIRSYDGGCLQGGSRGGTEGGNN